MLKFSYLTVAQVPLPHNNDNRKSGEKEAVPGCSGLLGLGKPYLANSAVFFNKKINRDFRKGGQGGVTIL